MLLLRNVKIDTTERDEKSIFLKYFSIYLNFKRLCLLRSEKYFVSFLIIMSYRVASSI